MMAAVAVALAASSAAQAQSDCANDTTPVYTDACGPTFALPGWGHAGGWTDASKYSTIQLADLNGDGRDELLAHNDRVTVRQPIFSASSTMIPAGPRT